MNNDALKKHIDRLVDEYRDRCLWFLREDYYPVAPEQQLRALRHIEQHGDLDAFRRAAELRRCLLRNSREPSAVS